MNPMNWFESDNQKPPAELTEYEARLNPSIAWTQRIGSGSEEQYLKLVPAVLQGRVIGSDSDGRVQASDAQSGARIWSNDLEAPVAGGPGVGEGLVLLGTRDAQLIALDEASGAPLWRTTLSSEVLSVPRIRDGIVVVHTIDGKLFGLNARDGSRRWLYERTEPVLTLRGNSSPVISRSSVIAGFANGKLVSIDLSGGTAQWETQITAPRGRTELERIVDIDADPVIYDGMIYVATYQGEVAAVTEDTGVVLWRRKLSAHAGLAAHWRHVYVTDAEDRLWALDPSNGSALWKQDKLLNRQLSAPAILDDYVLVGDLEGYVHWLAQEDGSQLARLRIASAPIRSAPTVVDGIAYVYADDGTLAALSTPTPVETP